MMLSGRTKSLLAPSIVALALCVVATSASGSEGPPVEPSRVHAAPHVEPAAREMAIARSKALSGALTTAKLGAALAALGLVAFRQWSNQRAGAMRLRRTRSAALLLLALFAFAASYNFFQWRHEHGFHVHEFFHYYLGAKYFPELGYHGLYECAAAAATEHDVDAANRPHDIRDLQHVERRRPMIPARSLEACRALFSEARWTGFRHDTLLLKQHMTPEKWARVLTDQGFNASPTWLLLGRPLAEWTPAEPDALRRYARLDVAILAIGFGAVGLAFGLEGFSLAVLAWAANPLSGYEWVGDAPLRQFWFGTLMIGLSLLRRGRYAAASVFLAASSLIRLFPLFFPLGYATRQLRRWISNRRFDPGFIRFVVVGTASGLLMIALSIPIAGRGPGVIGEFAAEMSSYSALTGLNSMGLRALLTHSTETPSPRLVDGRLVVLESDRIAFTRRTFESRAPIYWAGVALLLVLFWRAMARAEDWEAACLGFVLVVGLTQAASYYMTCTVAAALLATRRIRIGTGLLSALVAWGGIALIFDGSATGYALSSGVALALSVFTLVAMRGPADDGVGRTADVASTARDESDPSAPGADGPPGLEREPA